MEPEIGDAAGLVWRYLDANGGTSPRRIREATKLPEQVLYMALGWLAREGQLDFAKDRRGLVVSLKGRAESKGAAAPGQGAVGAARGA